ncbi:MAG: HypC/HybG/HupF family hydrogenase formation chaperone [Lachnospiraceae bacterium]|nr:HypC/HybG/HupF family hydrogenase formation chaperone [Lachnospiraceae bacterium]
MCVALPGTVKEIIDERYVSVDFSGNTVKAASGLVDVHIGDRVLIHAGCIIQTVSEKEAMEIEEAFRELGEN